MDQILPLANGHFDNGQYALALNLYLEVLSLSSTKVSASLHYNCAICAINVQDYELSEHHLTEALNINPHYVKALLCRSQLFIMLNKLSDALDDLLTADKLRPSSPNTKSHLAFYYCLVQSYERSLHHLTQVLPFLSDLTLTPSSFQLCLASFNFSTFEDPLNLPLNLCILSAFTLLEGYKLERVAITILTFAISESFLRQVPKLKLNSNFPCFKRVVMFLLGCCYSSLEEFSHSIRYFSMALDLPYDGSLFSKLLHFGDEDVLKLRGICFKKVGMISKSVADFSKVYDRETSSDCLGLTPITSCRQSRPFTAYSLHTPRRLGSSLSIRPCSTMSTRSNNIVDYIGFVQHLFTLKLITKEQRRQLFSAIKLGDSDFIAAFESLSSDPESFVEFYFLKR
ncbi:hypothetical protein P9112_007348 [Eukaryota sp. TZLM1-RC]